MPTPTTFSIKVDQRAVIVDGGCDSVGDAADHLIADVRLGGVAADAHSRGHQVKVVGDVLAGLTWLTFPD